MAPTIGRMAFWALAVAALLSCAAGRPKNIPGINAGGLNGGNVIKGGKPAAPLKLKDGHFMTYDNKKVALKAVNWFGFNNHMTFLNGLWAGGSSANSDFATIAYELQLLGFNAIRLPFIFGDLKSPATIISGYCTNQSSLEELGARTVDPEDPNKPPAGKLPPPPRVPLFDVSVAGSCNSYIPGGTTMNRYLWHIQWLVANGWYVLVDYHPMGMEQTSYDVDEFVSAWKDVWGAIAGLPNFKEDMVGRVFIDIMNEPDSQGQFWQPRNDKAGLVELYLGVMDALDKMTPGAPIYFINGGGQGDYMGINWGNGFVTKASIVEDPQYQDGAVYPQKKMSDPRPFFNTLLKKPYANRVVISPHVYGPSVSGRVDFFEGEDLWTALDNSFGYLNKKGYCNGGKCQVFPIAIGEFGSRFTRADDLRHLRDFAKWLRNEVPGHKDTHNPVENWFYWCYNANSGDTGGLVDDSWMNLEWVKLRWLRENLGLTPWYDKPSGTAAERADATRNAHNNKKNAAKNNKFSNRKNRGF